jgi:hypothetical protein
MRANITATFDRIIHLEWTLKTEKAGRELGHTGAMRAACARRVPKVQADLYAMIDSLSVDELRAFAEYRKANTPK